MNISAQQGVGVASMVCLSTIHLPQIAHTYRIKSAREISWGFLATNLAVSCLSATYGVLIDQPPLYIANAVCFGNTLVLLGMKCFYGKTSRKVAISADAKTGTDAARTNSDADDRE